MKSVYFILAMALMTGSCREKYEVVLPPAQLSFLVVEGSIITNGISTIKMSRTTPLDERNTLFESGATVVIESDDNTIIPLTGKDSGVYESPALNLNEDVKYRINIKTRDNLEYVSNYVQPVKTPEIDTITWTRYNDGIEIFVNANDQVNNTQYYKWDYDESWEFESPFKKYAYSVVTLNPLVVTMKYYDSIGYSKYNDSIDICWQFRKSTGLKLGTTTRLSENKVYVPMVFYPKASWEFSKLYSMLIRQYGISKEEYEFLQKMKKNTESLGTIFDAQPTELKGNIRCLTDSTKLTVGYIGATRLKEKRTFINNKDLIDWEYVEDCQLIRVDNHPDSLIKYFYYPETRYEAAYPLIQFSEVTRKDTIYTYLSTIHSCVDCTLRGVNKKPSFWP